MREEGGRNCCILNTRERSCLEQKGSSEQPNRVRSVRRNCRTSITPELLAPTKLNCRTTTSSTFLGKQHPRVQIWVDIGLILMDDLTALQCSRGNDETPFEDNKAAASDTEPLTLFFSNTTRSMYTGTPPVVPYRCF
jgi:hypothetical protein